MRGVLEKRLAAFVKKARGEMSYADFGAKTDLSKSSVFEIEQGTHSITLATVEKIARGLRVSIKDMFGDLVDRAGLK
jgi:transcriptional regulator with XRE-family HTH domain